MFRGERFDQNAYRVVRVSRYGLLGLRRTSSATGGTALLHGKLVMNRSVPWRSSKANPVCSDPPLNCPQSVGTCDTHTPKISCGAALVARSGRSKAVTTSNISAAISKDTKNSSWVRSPLQMFS